MEGILQSTPYFLTAKRLCGLGPRLKDSTVFTTALSIISEAPMALRAKQYMVSMRTMKEMCGP